MTEKPPIHPLLGLEDEVPSEPPPPPTIRYYEPEIPPPASHVGKFHCDSCGFLNGHAPGCPAVEAAEALAEIEAEERAEAEVIAIEKAESVRYLTRKLLGAILRKVAKTIEGDDK